MRVEESILLNEIRKQNREVFEALFKEYYPVLIKYAEGFVFNSQVCEDITQNLFIYFWENANNVTVRTSLKAYLFQSIKNRCLNYLRDLHVLDKRNLLFLEASLNSADPDIILEPELINKIQKAIDCLPDQMAVVFRLKYNNGFKHKEIAKSLNISENTVKTQLSRAKTKLKKRLLDSTSLNFIF
jgi:RNA polymerase sigma-70 factor (ECF subfamily)